ncbi:hypothetical protein QFC21_005125 [Naganishia friedmannii]|uniref:Uncharacterized protein n=1 Tax=Naganishia friedmannii TaxID=89922 RepID=A0ACC2VD35_9TREE|nr:hypothetical protein QFC21_005125 [Naganishia friedmannii]
MARPSLGSNPINLATDTTTPLPPHDTNTVVEEDEDEHPIIVVPPAIVEDLTDEEKREREGYARFVWRTVVDLEGVSVELLGDGTKALSKGKGRASEVVLHEEGGEGEVDEAAELGRIAEDDELAKGDDELRTVEEPMMGPGHEDVGDDDDDGFAIDPALATLAPAPATTAPTSAAKNTSTEPAAAATTSATQATTSTPGGIPESEKHDLMLLKEKYGDKVVLRASIAYSRPETSSASAWTAVAYLLASFHVSNVILFYLAAVLPPPSAAEIGEKEMTSSLRLLPALVEGTKSLAILTVMIALPNWFLAVTCTMTALVVVNVLQRTWVAREAFAEEESRKILETKTS